MASARSLYVACGASAATASQMAVELLRRCYASASECTFRNGQRVSRTCVAVRSCVSAPAICEAAGPKRSVDFHERPAAAASVSSSRALLLPDQSTSARSHRFRDAAPRSLAHMGGHIQPGGSRASSLAATPQQQQHSQRSRSFWGLAKPAEPDSEELQRSLEQPRSDVGPQSASDVEAQASLPPLQAEAEATVLPSSDAGGPTQV